MSNKLSKNLINSIYSTFYLNLVIFGGLSNFIYRDFTKVYTVYGKMKTIILKIIKYININIVLAY